MSVSVGVSHHGLRLSGFGACNGEGSFVGVDVLFSGIFRALYRERMVVVCSCAVRFPAGGAGRFRVREGRYPGGASLGRRMVGGQAAEGSISAGAGSISAAQASISAAQGTFPLRKAASPLRGAAVPLRYDMSASGHRAAVRPHYMTV